MLNKKNNFLIPVNIVIFLAAVLILFQIVAVIVSFGKVPLIKYLSVLISVLLYYSIIKYSIDYFYKGKDTSLESVILRYIIGLAISVINFQGEKNLATTFSVINLVLVPYFTGSLKRGLKVNRILAMVILVLSILVAGSRILDLEFTGLSGFSLVAHIIESCNSAIQWLLFTILFLTRGLLIGTKSKE